MKKRFTAEEKVKILREHLTNKVSISDLAEKHGLQPSAISNWKKTLFEGAVSTFNKTQTADKEKDKKIEKLEQTLQKRDTLIANIVEDNVDLRKKYNGEV
jgi:transposase